MRIACLVVLVLTAILILGDYAESDDYMSAMVGVANSGKATISETKFVNAGHRDEIGAGLTEQYEAGGWVDIAGSGRRGSAYAAYQVGVQAGEGVIARVMAGPALITTPDAYLGGYLNFTEDFFLGIRGPNGNSVGVKMKHISNAGITQPNVGRDLAGVEVSIPF